MQWNNTRSSGRTQVRSAQVEEGERGGGECLRFVGGGVEKWFRFHELGKKGPGREGGLISRLCVQFFLAFGSRGLPISLPRSFIPVHVRTGTYG